MVEWRCEPVGQLTSPRLSPLHAAVTIMPKSGLPTEFDSLSRLVDAQEPNVREMFQYALVLLMVEDGKGSRAFTAFS